jgi:diaminohydroxyphosphoribosylaminopyrimidine deaminase / 5-amino-6-(5-phosphoribosylamino)uracil reductase
MTWPDDPGRLVRDAVALAAAHRPHPNPRVGALVVDATGAVLGSGAHVHPGLPHAERLALEAAGPAAEGATLVVTLEPCVHHGRTPPCADAVIAAGVSRVIVGAGDPDPRVSGGGIRRLREAGIEVLDGIESGLVERADPGYFHHRRTGRSRVVHKAALTLDGQTAAADGTSQWITSDAARRDGHELRAEMDGVMVGAGTLIGDDPRLSVRLEGYDGPQPRPVIVAGTRPLPPGAAIWLRDPLVLAPVPMDVPGDVVVVPGPGGSVDLDAGLRATADAGLLDLLLEGGAALAGALFARRLVDAGVWYLAGLIAGGVGQGVFDLPFDTLAAARPTRITGVRPVGPDLRIDWEM